MHAFDLPGSDAIGDTYGLQDHQIKQQSQLQPHTHLGRLPKD